MGDKFQYEWWTVDLLLSTGRCTTEFKGRDREHVIRQINNYVKRTNSAENISDPWHKKGNPVKAVYWETLSFDRRGFQSGCRRID